MTEGNTGGTDTSGRQDPLIGRRLASYEVLARVARGGMGVVYRARHVYIDKIVALKVLDPALAQREDLIERFRTEAQSLARVEHENVVKVIDILEDKGVHFIVMDFAEGTNLRVLVKENGKLTGDELLSVARQTAEALYAAHREGILHRDIKPENLIMNSRGRCKLADFGLAGDLRLISEGHEGPLNFGTPAYSAPEVLRRMVPDKRSDIFSFGATMYFLATGEPPFGQTGAQAIMLRQKQGAELLDARRPDLPPKFTQLLMDCIRYHPKDRPSSFMEVLEALPKRMVTRRIAATGTGPTEPTDLTQMDSGTHETPDLDAGSPRLLIGLAVMAIAAIVVVAFLWIGGLLRDADNGISAANNAPSNAPTNTAIRPPTNAVIGPANTEPGDGVPAFRPEDEAFNAAELESRASLSGADYKGAYDAWASFLRRYPNTEYQSEARERQRDVVKRVSELREKEYDKAKQASDEALKDKRTAEAIGALDRFPAELLVPLSDTDEIDVARKLETQRQWVLAAESEDLARLLQKADDLRGDWQKDQDGADTLGEFQLMRNAGNLLKERDLLEAYIPGRTADSVDKITKRLAKVRQLLESVHQASELRTEAWRGFQDETLGQWSADALNAIGKLRTLLENRDFKAAYGALDALETDLAARRAKAATEVGSPALAKKINESTFVSRQVQSYREDLLLADRVTSALASNLRAIRQTNSIKEYLVHAEKEADGTRSSRVEKYSGRVTAVGSSDFSIEDDGKRVTIDYDMLTVSSVRRLIHNGESFDEHLSLVAWLVALGRDEDADSELAKVERMTNVPDDVLTRARAIAGSKRLAPDAIRRLTYFAWRAGLRKYDDLDAILEEESLLRRLATAQRGIERGDTDAAKQYLAIVNEVVDPELVHLETFERATTLADPSVGDLRNWIVLEPSNPAAFAALAKALQAEGSNSEARTLAGKALILDGSNETAWGVWSK
ncbi:MAG: protein kinase [Planctomycetes bacterium]|nr:protein kinase [Planctomycetota bacterium]